MNMPDVNVMTVVALFVYVAVAAWIIYLHSSSMGYVTYRKERSFLGHVYVGLRYELDVQPKRSRRIGFIACTWLWAGTTFLPPYSVVGTLVLLSLPFSIGWMAATAHDEWVAKGRERPAE